MTIVPSMRTRVVEPLRLWPLIVTVAPSIAIAGSTESITGRVIGTVVSTGFRTGRLAFTGAVESMRTTETS